MKCNLNGKYQEPYQTVSERKESMRHVQSVFINHLAKRIQKACDACEEMDDTESESTP